MRDTATRLNLVAWLASTLAALVAIIAWGQSVNWHLAGISTYRLFPLFGLLAFSLMWSHYIASVARQQLGLEKAVLARYVEITSWIVLLVIVLHPGLLVWQLGRDGYGLPPGSFLNNYVAAKLKWVALLGTVSFFVFLAYELRRWFDRKKWWPWIALLTDIAMVAIFYHGLRLGDTLQHGWFRIVWYSYGITLIGALIYIYINKFKVKKLVAS